MSKSDRIPSGIPGLDLMLEGGYPKSREVLLVGGPGAGKTIFCTQFIINGIEKYDENGIFVSMDESKHHFAREMSAFGWDIKQFEKEKKMAFIDASPIMEANTDSKNRKITIGNNDFSLSHLIKVISSNVEAINAERIVIDPLTSLVFQYPDVIRRRRATLDLIEGLRNTGATSILTTELRTRGVERNVQLEEYLAHGVILLQAIQVGKYLMRTIQIEKMRETSIDSQVRPYKIANKGIETYPKESVF